MRYDHEGVALVRWEAAAEVASIAEMRAGVSGFGGRAGMTFAARGDMASAVAHALAAGVPDASAPAGTARVSVAAATDGTWLSVRVDADAGRLDEASYALLRGVDRVDAAPGTDGAGSSVLMEFAIRPAGRRLRRHSHARTSRGAARGSCSGR